LYSKIFVLTENLNFFFRLNEELKRLNIKFKVLNIGNKIPNLPCLILTTSDEIEEIENRNNQYAKFLTYSKNEDLDKYILKVLAAYRIGYKDKYSELVFSIDPGTKHIGLVVFLDDYYLNSQTFFKKEELLNKVIKYIETFQNDAPNSLNLKFKFGRGVLPITLELISNFYTDLNGCKNVRVFLIDESKSSKLKIIDKKRKIPKDEASALILALRDGIEVNQENYVKIFSDIKLKKFKGPNNKRIYNNSIESIEVLKDIIEKLLDGEISLSKSLKSLQECRRNNNH